MSGRPHGLPLNAFALFGERRTCKLLNKYRKIIVKI